MHLTAQKKPSFQAYTAPETATDGKSVFSGNYVHLSDIGYEQFLKEIGKPYSIKRPGT
jgi:hypothetical protein